MRAAAARAVAGPVARHGRMGAGGLRAEGGEDEARVRLPAARDT